MGRKKPFLIAVVMQVSMGILAVYMSTYWGFSFIRFIIGLSVGGTMVIGFVIVMEYIGPQYRHIISALYQAPFNVGHITLTGFGYYFRRFRHFQMAISVPTALMLTYFWLVPETPRWLIAVNRIDEATAILEYVAKV